MEPTACGSLIRAAALPIIACSPDVIGSEWVTESPKPGMAWHGRNQSEDTQPNPYDPIEADDDSASRKEFSSLDSQEYEWPIARSPASGEKCKM